MKAIVLTRGGLPESYGGNPCSDARLSWQKSAEAVVPRLVGERAEQQRFCKLEGFERDAKKADNPERELTA
jgi:hypothetical protein